MHNKLTFHERLSDESLAERIDIFIKRAQNALSPKYRALMEHEVWLCQRELRERQHKRGEITLTSDDI